MSRCKFCQQQVHWFSVNGYNQLFDDDAHSLPHICPVLRKRKKITETVSSLQDFVNSVSNRIESHSDAIELLCDRVKKLEELALTKEREAKH